MSDYDMPICKQHQKEMMAEIHKAAVVWVITLCLAFIMGYSFAMMTAGAP